MATSSAAVLQETHDVLQECGISKRVAYTRLIDNEFFNYHEDFSFRGRGHRRDGDVEASGQYGRRELPESWDVSNKRD